MSSKFTCRFCKEQFDVPKGLYKHLQSAHNAGASRDNRTCPICGVLCSKYEGYRDHLLYIHGQADDGQKLTFKSLNEFLVWKAELELKHDCKYVLQSTPKVLSNKEKKYFYQCDRSNSKCKDKKALTVIMKTCSSVISVVEGPGVFKVEYWDTHTGHSAVPTPQSLQNELEAAISSVEMVNAIADSDDSFERSEDILLSGHSSPSASNAEKPFFFKKTNEAATNNPSLKKTTIMVPSAKGDEKKKTGNSSVLFSLASVACGKGIAKKPSNKVPVESPNIDASKPETEIKNVNDKCNEKTVSTPEVQKSNLTLSATSGVASPKQNSSSAPPTILPSPSITSTKKIAPAYPAIAPKVTNAPSKNTNSLTASNNAFPNQYVIVNPVNMDQNSLNSKQNVFSPGQNIVLSLGSLGQNILPATSTPQSINAVSVGDKNATSITNVTVTKPESSANAPAVLSGSSKTSLTTSQSMLKNNTSIATSSVASTVSISGFNNAPVILSSLPVGSTFMSLNNNLIPIATPSGAFLPTTLPPNIVLTPVVPGTTISNIDSSLKSTFSSAGTLSVAPPNIQSQIRYTVPSTVAITVSSIVKEPVYTSSAIKHMSNIVTSNTIPVSSAPSIKTYSKNQDKPAPITISGSVSPLKNISKFITSTPIKSGILPKLNKNLTNSTKVNLPVRRPISEIDSEEEESSFVSKKSRLSSVIPSATVSSIKSPLSGSSARKRINKSVPKSKIGENSANSSRTSSTKVVNSQLNSAPISSAKITSDQINVHKPGSFVFESSGDVYMLEPVDDGDLPKIASPKKAFSSKVPKRKIDRSIQTIESLNAKSKIQKKRGFPPTDDSAVMLKVKCFQLEMQYLNVQTECKRLKVELTKERLKNAELTGKKEATTNVEEETSPNISRSNATEIMKEIEEKFSGKKDVNIYTMTKTSVLRSLYEDLEELCTENCELHKELEKYRAHDKFYKSLKKKLYDEEF